MTGLRWIPTLAIVVGLLLGAVGWIGSSFVVRPPWYTGLAEDGRLPSVENASWNGVDTDPLDAFGIAFEAVSFPAEDGKTLRGWFVPPRSDASRQAEAALVLVHGGGGDRRDYLRHVPIFHQSGWPVLLFDCREQGASDGSGRGISLGAREHRDVSSAVAWLRAVRGFGRIGVLGTSQGGASVILAAARDPGIDAVAAENPFATVHGLLEEGARGLPWLIRAPLVEAAVWRTFGQARVPQPLDVVGAIAPRPLLLLHGTADATVLAAESEALFAAAAEPKQLWLAPDAGHTQIFDTHPVEYTKRLLGFFEPLRRSGTDDR